MAPGFLVDSLTRQSEPWPITHWPPEVVILRFTSDSSPLAEVNNEPWSTRGTRDDSSEDFSPNVIGISLSEILLNLSIIFFNPGDESDVGFPIVSDSGITKNCFSVFPKCVSITTL